MLLSFTLLFSLFTTFVAAAPVRQKEWYLGDHLNFLTAKGGEWDPVQRVSKFSFNRRRSIRIYRTLRRRGSVRIHGKFCGIRIKMGYIISGSA